MTVRRTCAALILLAAVMPAQQNPSSVPKTGSVSGAVVETKSGDALAKATVVLRQGQQSGIGTTTGRDGKFTLRDINPGTYTITVERDGYVIPKGKPQTVVVEPGQDTSDVQLKMARTGAISGRVIDPDGDPVPGVSVMISPVVARNRLPPGVYAMTNDRGEYRGFHIAPGDYRISVLYTPRNVFGEIRMQRPIAGDVASSAEAFPRVYYPAALDPRQATVVTVEPGAELNGYDLQLIRAHGVRIRGRVTAVAGNGPAPLFQFVSLTSVTSPNLPGQPHTVLIRDPKGEFELDDVLPGRYRLQVDAGVADDSQRMTARLYLDVGASDIDGIQLTPLRTQRLAGSITPPQGRKVSPGLMAVLAPRDREDRQGGGMTQVNPDGTFTFQQVQPGNYDLQLGSMNGGDDSYVFSMRVGEADALADGIHVGEAPPGPLQILLKANGAALDCTVTGENGEPIPMAKVALIPDPPRERQAAFIGDCVTQSDGTCKIQGIAPGEYHVYALPSDSEINYRDSDALKPLEKFGQPLQFAEGDRKSAQLKLPPE